jgi:hypothetical protein
MIKPSKIDFSAAARGCCTGLMTINVKKLPVNSPHSGYASPCWRVMPDTRCTVQPGKYDRSRRRASAGRRLCTGERGVDDGHTALAHLHHTTQKPVYKITKIKWNPPLPVDEPHTSSHLSVGVVCPCTWVIHRLHYPSRVFRELQTQRSSNVTALPVVVCVQR